MTDKMQDFLAEIIDNYGESAIVTEKDFSERGVIPTGSLSLDISMGTGGVPRGMYTQIFGPESSGKTTIALSIADQAMKMGLNVLYLDAERSLDYKYVNSIIGDFDDSKLKILSPDAAEDFFSVAEDAIDSDIFELIIMDSLAGLSPRKEQEDDLEDANVALLPRLLTKWLRRNSFKIKKKNIAFVFLNQVRDPIGSYMGGYVAPGGNALKHFEAIKIKLTKGGKITGKDKDITGVISKFVVVKNKLAPPYRGATIPIMFGTGVDKIRDVLEFAKTLGVVRLSGSFYRLGEETLGQGVEKAKQYLSTTPDTLDKIIKICYNTVLPDLGVKPETKETEENE
jgi:recombination protein RecA